MRWRDRESEPLVVPTRWALLQVALGRALVWPCGGGAGFTEESVGRRPPCYLPLEQLYILAVTPDMQVVLEKLIKSMISPSLSNDDLPQISNGMKNEPITMSPLFSTFTKDKIINCFQRVGYAPFIRECLKSPYIRDEIGENQEDTCLDELVNEYEEAKLDLKKEGFNVEGIFDAEIPTATNLRGKETEYEQAKALIERRGGFSASSIYTNVRTVCITLGVVLKAQM